MDTEAGALVVPFLSLGERQRLRAVCRRWHYTCAWLQYRSEHEGAMHPPKSVFNFESRKFRHEWHSFIKAQCAQFLPPLLARLPHSIEEHTNELKRGLCESTNTGVRPSFENAHARSGYIQAKINRCGNLPNLLLTHELSDLRSQLFRRTGGVRRWTIALYGGGPGFDTAGLVFLRKFLRAPEIELHTIVYDNEPGWAHVIHSVQHTLDGLGFSNATWGFEHCDITEDVASPVNASVARDLAATQLFVFSFVCVENFRLLRRSKFAFLQSLFSAASAGSVFIFTDSTHRLWPTIYAQAEACAGSRFVVWTPFARGCHYALILRKLPAQEPDPHSHPFYEASMDRLALFGRHQSDQLKTMSL